MIHYSKWIRKKYFICSQLVLIINPCKRWNEIWEKFQIVFKESMTIENKHDMV
jgi:hypothetical protein